uniref:NADP-dependent oxidoreductase domain-containing protein n=1 Tax=Timema genevievae TaxID=629358 RepID=A0A7R9PMC6_TIMGE|nr:unnamed protein product [Timema genevievae]
MHASFHILTLFQSEPGVVKKAVEDAIDAGYRHIDGAHIYGNEKEVGAGIRNKIAEGIVKREELFITSKVNIACKNTLADLGLDYLDLYLIHWPFAFRDNGELFPMKDGKADVVDVDVTETWKGMEECVKLGFAKSIGISNFNSEQIKKVVNSATIKPVTNQVECHPYLNQKKLREFCKQHNIVITAYSPLGNPGSKFNAPGTPNILQDTKLNELAKKHGKSVAQIILRYLIDVGTVPIPKSVTKTRIEENINVFDFKLSPEELAYVDSIDRNLRTCAFDTYVSTHTTSTSDNDTTFVVRPKGYCHKRASYADDGQQAEYSTILIEIGDSTLPGIRQRPRSFHRRTYSDAYVELEEVENIQTHSMRRMSEICASCGSRPRGSCIAQYNQLYFLEVEIANKIRQQQHEPCQLEAIARLKSILCCVNPYHHIHSKISDVIAAEDASTWQRGERPRMVMMPIKIGMGRDPNIYNLSVAQKEVSAILMVKSRP